MNITLIMILCFAAGALLGIIFFGGLWFTVRKALRSKLPAFWIIGSFVLRVCITILGFYFISGDEWQRLVLCLLGFIVARFVVIRNTGNWDAKQVNLTKEEFYGTKS